MDFYIDLRLVLAKAFVWASKYRCDRISEMFLAAFILGAD